MTFELRLAIRPVLQVLLDKGAEVNDSDEVTSVTPLMAAAQCGHMDVVSVLLKAGSNVNARLIATGQHN